MWCFVVAFDSSSQLIWDQRQREHHVSHKGPVKKARKVRRRQSRLKQAKCPTFFAARLTRSGHFFTLALHFHAVDAQHNFLFCSFSVSRSRSSSHALTLPRSSHLHSLLASILFNLFSPPTAYNHDQSSSLPHSRRLILAASSSLHRPRSNFSSSRAPLTLLTLINRPLQVLLSPPT